MKIDPNLQPIANLQSDAVPSAKTRNAQEANGGAQNAPVDGGDTVQFSGELLRVHELTAKLQQIPEIRADRVAALKARIEQGTYKPSSKAVADAMLKDLSGRGGQS
jgi:negative regulator of flagellin synthesis FlgM